MVLVLIVAMMMIEVNALLMITSLTTIFQTVGRHGCASAMEHLSHYSATCKYAPHLPHDHLHHHQLSSTTAPLASMHLTHLTHPMIIFIAINLLIRDNGESCWQVDEASLDHDHGQGNATIIEVLKEQ